jgi:sporulation protein YlmC with PRC-barrel domain
MRFTLSLAGVVVMALPLLAQEVARPVARDTTVRHTGGLIGASVTRDGRTLGRVSDIQLTDAGAISTLMVRTANGVVEVPYSTVRYDRSTRTFAVAAPKAEIRPDTDPAAVRFSDRAGRLVRTEEPVPAARIERVPPVVVVPTDPAATQRMDMAVAARIYSVPIGSVSLTGNINRLPSRSPAYDNYTIWSEASGRRSPWRVPGPPAIDFQGSTSSTGILVGTY